MLVGPEAILSRNDVLLRPRKTLNGELADAALLSRRAGDGEREIANRTRCAGDFVENILRRVNHRQGIILVSSLEDVFAEGIAGARGGRAHNRDDIKIRSSHLAPVGIFAGRKNLDNLL